MSKIKVAIIITKLELGGAQKVAISLCEKLDKEKYEPFLICGCGGILDDEVKEKNKVYFVKNLVRPINPLKDIKAFFAVYKILKKENPDIVHTHSSKAGIIGRCAAYCAGFKNIVHTIHGFSFNSTQNFFKRTLFIYLEKLCSAFSKYLIPVSVENTKKGIFNKIGDPEKYHYIRLGIDIDNFKNFRGTPGLKQEFNISESDILVTTIGPFKPQKNLKDFIKIAANILKRQQNFKFVITGDGVLRPELEKQITEYKIKDKIFLIGWRRDISNILNSSDIFVMTSLWEGLPISVIEAMCCGLAPIVNNVDGQKEIIKDGVTGFLVKPYDVKTAEEKIMLLAQNKALKKEMGQNAKNSIDKTFSTDYMIKEHEELYLKMVKQI